MFRGVASINEKEVKRFISLSSNSTDYVDCILFEDKLIIVSYTRELSVYMRLNFKTNDIPRNKVEFRIKKSILSQLATDGYMFVELSDKLKLRFTSDIEKEGIIIETDLQVANSSEYINFLFLNLNGYEKVDLSCLSNLTKVANLLGTYVSVDDEIAFIEYNRSFFFQHLNLTNISLQGSSLKKLLTFKEIYNYENYLIGITDDITIICNKLKPSYFSDYRFIEKRLDNYIFSTNLSMTPLALLSKKCKFSNGECKLNLSNGRCYYEQDGITYSINLGLTNYSDITISIPNWIVKNILSVYPDLLSNIELRLYKNQVLIKSKSFSLLYVLKRI